MKMLEDTQDKIQKLCDRLKQEAIEPGREEARQIIEQATKEAAQIVSEAEQKARALLKQARTDIERERALFENAIAESAKQAVASLRETLEQQFFNKSLYKQISEATRDPQVIAKMLNALVKAIETEGTKATLRAILPTGSDVDALLALLMDDVRARLEKGSITVSNFQGGVRLKLVEQSLTFDLSDEALVELLTKSLRKEFRKWLFA